MNHTWPCNDTQLTFTRCLSNVKNLKHCILKNCKLIWNWNWKSKKNNSYKKWCMDIGWNWLRKCTALRPLALQVVPFCPIFAEEALSYCLNSRELKFLYSNSIFTSFSLSFFSLAYSVTTSGWTFSSPYKHGFGRAEHKSAKDNISAFSSSCLDTIS